MNTHLYKSVVVSDVGKVRTNNEDNFYQCGIFRYDTDQDRAFCEFADGTDNNLYSVCDGMGGIQFGEIASLIAVQNLNNYKNNFNDKIEEYIKNTNELICQRRIDIGCASMGTTFAGLYIEEDYAHIYNIGDSRAYIFRNGKLTQVSEDHTQLQRMIKMGLIAPEDSKNRKEKHQLTQFLGIEETELVIEVRKAEPMECEIGDVFLLCSDGLTDMLEDEQIKEVLSKDMSLGQKAMELVDAALFNGGKDNTTVLLIEVCEKIEEKSNAVGKFFKNLLGDKE